MPFRCLCGGHRFRKAWRNKKHLRGHPDLTATQAEVATDNAQKEGEGERMLTEPQARPKREVNPPEWLKDYVT